MALDLGVMSLLRVLPWQHCTVAFGKSVCVCHHSPNSWHRPKAIMPAAGNVRSVHTPANTDVAERPTFLTPVNLFTQPVFW